MAQLIVRNIDEKIVHRLRQLAADDGVSVEEKHRRILRESLLGQKRPKGSFADFLCAIPAAGANEPRNLFARRRDLPRKVKL